MYANDWAVTLAFDLMEGHSPLVVGMAVRQDSDTCNRTWSRSITFERPHDKREFTLFKYVAHDSTGNRWLRLEIAAHVYKRVSTLLASACASSELKVVKRVNKLGHATPAEMTELLSGTYMEKGKVREACDKVHYACMICPGTGRPAIGKTYLRHMLTKLLMKSYRLILHMKWCMERGERSSTWSTWATGMVSG